MKEMPQGPLDDLDRQIVAALLLNPRASWRYIADLAQTSESTLKRRAERLLAAGAVRTTVIAEGPQPSLHVLVQIVCELSRVAHVGSALASRPDVRFVALVTGPFDIVAELVIPSHRHLTTIMVDELPAISGIMHTTTETVVRNFKTAYDWSHSLLGSEKVDPPKESQASQMVATRTSLMISNGRCLRRSKPMAGRPSRNSLPGPALPNR